MDITSYILSKKYIEDSLAGAGAVQGKSAYDIACDNGFKGTPAEWLESLKGLTPQIGPKGTWLIGDVDTGVIASPSLAGYATEDFVELMFNSVPKVDLTPYATRKELSEAILGIVIPDVSNFATRDEVNKAIAAIVFPETDLSNYPTRKEVTDAINAIPKPDLSPYATKDEVRNAINAIPEVDLSPYAKKTDLPSVEGLASESYVQEQIGNIVIPEQPDLSPYALKSELPSIEGLATEEFVNQKFNEIKHPSVDLTGYATEEFVQQKVAEAQLGGNKEVDLSAYYTKSEIDKKFDEVEHPVPDLSGYATEEFVENAVNGIVIPSTEGLATEEFVEEAIASIQVPDVTGLATETYVDEAIAAIEHPAVNLEPYAKKEDLPSVEGLASEAYVNEKFNSIEIPDVDFSGLATEEYVQTAIADLVGSAPDTLNTLDELAAALEDNSDIVGTLTTAIGNKADKSEIPSVAGLASEEYVNNAIAAIQIPEAKPDINVYEITSESAVLDELVALLPEGVEIHSGDVMLVSNSMGVKSAYQFDEGWIACDGNVDASRVIMPFDITLAGSYETVGNLTKTKTGTATFATRGKSVAAALQEMLSKREQPKNPSQPSVSLTATSGAKEVGTEVTPTWSASLSAGSYTYGPATGIVAKTWTISDTDGHSASTASGSFAKFTVGDDTNYKITAKATYDAGAVAKDNLGDPSNPTVQIAAGSKSATSSSITGYRAWFMYVGESLNTIDSAFIRGTTNKGATPSTQSGVTIPAGTKRVMVAIPANGSNLTSVIDVDGMGLDVFGNFTKMNVDVEGLNGYQVTSYDVWVADNENGLAATHYNLVIG